MQIPLVSMPFMHLANGEYGGDLTVDPPCKQDTLFELSCVMGALIMQGYVKGPMVWGKDMGIAANEENYFVISKGKIVLTEAKENLNRLSVKHPT